MYMRFHKELYIGDSIKNIRKVKWKLKHHAGQLGIFVMVLSEGSDQLEIYHCVFLQQQYYKKYPPYIVGIAGGHEEAVELLQKMISDVYEKTGSYQLKEYFLKG